MKETLYYVAQVITVLAFLACIISFWCKDRKKILRVQVVSTSLYSLQYILLGGYSGFAVNIIGVIRSLVFSNKKDNSKRWLVILSVAYIIIGIITWDSIISLFPVIASLVYVFLSYNDNPQLVRLGYMIACVFWIVYNFSVKAYVGCVTEFILIISSALSMIKYKKKSGEIDNSLNVE